MAFFQRLKKIGILFVAAFALSITSINHLYAQDSNANADIVRYLKLIEQHTNDILTKVNDLPTYLGTIAKEAQSWLKEDDSDQTAKIQTDFNTLGTLITNSMDPKTQTAIINQLTADAFGQPASSLTSPNDNPAILSVLPINLINLNDITYSTVLGLPPIPKKATALSPYNYIKYASGIRNQHVIPDTSWGGETDKQLNYLIYFATVKAIESFNGYTLSHLLSEPQFSASQINLINQATDPKWLAQVASEELGKVLRQLLLFQSQSYVLLTQQIQIEKQILAASTMTNTVLILNNATNETLIVAKAKGEQPQP